MTEPQERAAIEHLDFTVSCHYPRVLTGGRPCTQSAEWFVVVHRAGFCTHPSLENGCASSFVCADHLAALEIEADRIVRRSNPAWWMFWRPERGWCRSCGRQRIQHAGDVLQIVRGIL